MIESSDENLPRDGSGTPRRQDMLCYLSDHANLHAHVSVGCWAKTVLPNRLLICAGQSEVLQSEADSRSTVSACSLQSLMCPTDDSVCLLAHAAQRCSKRCFSSPVCGVSTKSDVTVLLLPVLEDPQGYSKKCELKHAQRAKIHLFCRPTFL